MIFCVCVCVCVSSEERAQLVELTRQQKSVAKRCNRSAPKQNA